MFRDPKIQGAAILFTLFFVVATIIAWYVPAMQAQYETFIFGGLAAMYSILLIFVKPDGGIPDKDKQVSLPPSQPSQGDK